MEMTVKPPILPHSGAVEMDHHPFGRIESDRVGEFDTVEPVAEFRAQESRSSVGGIDVQPEIFWSTFRLNLNKWIYNFFPARWSSFKIMIFTDDADLSQMVKSAGSSRTECGTYLDN